MKRKNLKIVFL